jgi:hypothetical protein
MELQEERLIDEILWESPAGSYCPPYRQCDRVS